MALAEDDPAVVHLEGDRVAITDHEGVTFLRVPTTAPTATPREEWGGFTGQKLMLLLLTAQQAACWDIVAVLAGELHARQLAAARAATS